MYKVGVWGPGSMGLIALRGVIDHPQLQLVDLVVHSDAKAGRDAGELCGIAAVGVRATKEPEGILAGDADVVVYAAAANLRPAEAIADMVSLLRAGKNVVSCSVVPLVFPDAVDAVFTEPLRAAAIAGGVSFFTTGIDSGFANDVLPLVLTGVSRVIESVRMTEMFNYATYPDKDAVYEILGFGKPPEETPFAATPGVFTFGWGPVLHQLAAGLGHEDRQHRRERRTGRCRGILRHSDRTHRRGHDRRDAVHADRIRRRHTNIRRRPCHADARRHRPGLAAAAYLHRAKGSRIRVGVRRGVSTASRSRARRACAASSRWPTTTITTWARGWPAHPGWSTPSRRCAKPSRVCCRRWICRWSPARGWSGRCPGRRRTAGSSSSAGQSALSRHHYFQKAFMGWAYMSLAVSGSRVPGVARKVSSIVAIRLYSL